MKSKDKIVIVSCVFPPEPLVSARLSEDIANRISDHERVVVLCPRPSRPNGYSLTRDKANSKFETITLSSFICPESRIFGRLKESYSFGKAGARYIEEHHEEIKAIYANTHPTFGQYFLIKVAHKYNIPCAIHIQDLYPESITSKLGWIGKILNPFLTKVDSHYMRKASKLIAITNDMKMHLIGSRRLPQDFVKVVYNWQDESMFKTHDSSCKNSSPFTFMFLGNLNPTANLSSIIHAFGKTKSENVRLIIAGSGVDKDNLKALASQYPDKEILFEEVLPYQVPKMQSKADVLLLPLMKGISKTAMPSKLPAYMFSGKPILASLERDSEVGHIIEDYNCGWVVEPENIGLISTQMDKCVNQLTSNLEEMGSNGQSFGFAHFSKASNLKSICNIIDDLGHGN